MEKVPAQKTSGSFGARLDSVKNHIKSRAMRVLPAKESIKSRLPKWPIYYWIFWVVLVTTLAISGFYFYLSPQFKQKLLRRLEFISPPATEDIKEPAKPPPAPLASGPQTYMISGSTPGAPKITEATVDPIDPAQGSSQTWTLKIIDAGNGPTKEVTISIFTDNKNERHSLAKIEGTETESTWQGKWTLEDSYDYTYVAVLRAKNEAGKIHKVDLVLR